MPCESGTKPRVIYDLRPHCFTLGAIKNENEIQIGGIAELQSTQLATRHHCKTRVNALRLTMALYQFRRATAKACVIMTSAR